jgi:hypothetical protein
MFQQWMKAINESVSVPSALLITYCEQKSAEAGSLAAE